jgi:hypothetical protein
MHNLVAAISCEPTRSNLQTRHADVTEKLPLSKGAAVFSGCSRVGELLKPYKQPLLISTQNLNTMFSENPKADHAKTCRWFKL